MEKAVLEHRCYGPESQQIDHGRIDERLDIELQEQHCLLRQRITYQQFNPYRVTRESSCDSLGRGWSALPLIVTPLGVILEK